MNIKKEAINTIRCLSLDMIDSANSGHPGIALGAAPILFAIYSKLNINLTNDKFFNRDRFVMSAGHGSSILYATLHLLTNLISLEQLKDFRKIGSKTPGHPEFGNTPFVDCSSGPLGQGVANAVGMAIAEKHLASKFNKRKLNVIDHYTYCFLGDGDLMEGVCEEALALAGTLKLNKLICLFDNNNITIEGSTTLSRKENIAKKFKAMGFNVKRVGANNYFALSFAIDMAKKSNKPTLIICDSIIGYGSQRAGLAEAHGCPLGETLTNITKQNLEMPTSKFYISENVKNYFISLRQSKKKFVEKQNEILNQYEKEYPEEYEELKNYLNDNFKINLKFKDEKCQNMSTKQAGGIILNQIASQIPNLIGGCADVGPSTNAVILNGGDFSDCSPSGRTIHFGVREHAMAAICNGISLHGGLKVYCSTYFAFADYMKPAMRMSSLMKLPVVYIFSSDSIGAGEDGPTHQPVEQLAMLRATPNLNVFRPADFKECEACYEMAFESKSIPSVICLTKQKAFFNKDTDCEKAKQGAYIVKKEKYKNIDNLIIASGSEVYMAIEVANELEKKGQSTRVVSMVSTSVFDNETEKYKKSILPEEAKVRIIIEAGSSVGLAKYAGLNAINFTVDKFGASGTAQSLFDKFGLTKEQIIEKLLKTKK